MISRVDGQGRCNRSNPDVLPRLLVDKFVYHLPLYRQHQRIKDAGITLSRSTLTYWVQRTSDLLRPIHDAQLQHILLSRVLAMDETPIKAGRKKKGKMQSTWFWPLYGEDDELAFTWSKSRGTAHVEQQLGDFEGASSPMAMPPTTNMPETGPRSLRLSVGRMHAVTSSRPKTMSRKLWPRHWSKSVSSTR